MATDTKNTQNFGNVITNPKIGNDINVWIYEQLKKTWPDRAERYKKYRETFNRTSKLEVELDFPLHLVIEALFACNYQCPQCLLGIPETKKQYGGQGTMTMDDYKRIIDEAAKYNTPSILLNGVNEPLLDAHLFERIDYAWDNGFVDIQIHSNGELLTEEKCEQLLESKCTRFMVSLDAFSPETFSKIRVGGHYETVMENIDRFLKMREKKKKTLPTFRASMVRQKTNEHEADSFIDYWRPRADYIQMQTYLELKEEGRDNYYSGADSRILEDFHCEQPWYTMFIRPKGDIHPCCSFMNYDLKMSNTHNQSLHAAWNSPNYKNLRLLHKKGEYYKNEVCKKCVEGMFPMIAAVAPQ